MALVFKRSVHCVRVLGYQIASWFSSLLTRSFGVCFSLLYRIFFALLILIIAGCSQLHSQSAHVLSIQLPEDHRMHFSGRGAGAGVMLSSTLGPMGIALGIAIDQGIAKDIAKAGEAAGLNIQALLQPAFSSKITSDTSLLVERYGFVILPEKGGDTTLAQWHLKLIDAEGKAQRIRVPKIGCKIVIC